MLQLVEQGAQPSVIATPDYSRMGTSDKDALVAEVRSLGTKLDAQIKVNEGLRSDLQKIAGDQMVHSERVAAKSTNAIVSGLDDFGVAARSNKVNLNAF